MTVYSPSRKFVSKMITKWLDGWRESDGGWAAITPQDVNDLYSIINHLVELKCQADPDGDHPIDINLIDRTMFWPNQFRDVPYDGKVPDAEVLQALFDNAQMANSQLTNFLKTLSVNKLLKESK